MLNSQSEASSIHFLSTDILKEVEDHAQEKLEENKAVKDSEYEYEEDGSKRRIQKREVLDDPHQVTSPKTTDKAAKKAITSPKEDSQNRRGNISAINRLRNRGRRCRRRYRGRWITCNGASMATWRHNLLTSAHPNYPIRRM